MIKTIDEAVAILDGFEKKIPYEAIEFLRNQPTSEIILDKIVFALKNAYADLYYNEEINEWRYAPLWYAIVAEKHLSPKIIEPVVDLFFTTNDDWDVLSEQGGYLIGKLAKKYPDATMDSIMKAMDGILSKGKIELPYTYLFDAFYFIDINKYKSWFLNTLKNKNLFWMDSLASVSVNLKIKEAIPILKELIKIEKDKFTKRDLKYGLNLLEKGSTYQYIPYCETRENWDKHYKNFEEIFFGDDDIDSFKKLYRLKIEEVLKNISESDKPITETEKYVKKQKPGHEDSLKLAQKVLYKAEMEEDAQKRIALAKKAIEISPLCADAYCLLAEESDNIQTAIEYYKKGVEAGELAIGKETFLEDVGYFWGLLETRPYMRARFGLAQCLYKNGNFEEAISHYRELLRLNPSDNQGVRYSLASALANLKRYNELNQLLNSNDYREDSSANWLYTRALLDFVKFGESEKSIKTLREAIMVNPHVAKYLTGISSIPEILPDHITIGDEDEAMVYAFDFAKAWEIVPGSIEWLERNHSMQVQKKSTKIGRNDPCPCGSGKKYKKCCGK